MDSYVHYNANASARSLVGGNCLLEVFFENALNLIVERCYEVCAVFCVDIRFVIVGHFAADTVFGVNYFAAYALED